MCLLVLEKQPPRFTVRSPDSLDGGRAKNVFEFSFKPARIGVSYVVVELAFVVVAYEAPVIYDVLEGGESVQQVPWHLLRQKAVAQRRCWYA
jgi:hypothetical protein